MAKSNPDNVQWQRGLAVAYSNMGDALLARGDLTSALAFHRNGLADWRRGLAMSLKNVGIVQVGQGDFAGALESYRASLAAMESLTRSNPDNAAWQRDLAVTCSALADVYRRAGDREKALAARGKDKPS